MTAIQKAKEPTSAPETASPRHTQTEQRSVLSGAPGLFQNSFISQAGNQAVQRLLETGVIRPKLSISRPGDEEEREADRIAERAVSNAPVQGIEQKRAGNEDRKIRIKDHLGHIPQPASKTESHVASLRSGGQPLPSSTRAFFEPRFGRDLSQVRIHTDVRATEAAHSIQARAFTVGEDVVFAAGEFAPESREGRKLIAHELAHVLRAPGLSVASDETTIRRQPDPPPTGGTAGVSSPVTLDSLVRANPLGFTDAALDSAYQAYRRSERNPSDPRTWALRQTTGAPRNRLVQLLGPDYARGQLSGTAAPPIDVSQAAAPAGYGQDRAAQDLTALAGQPQALTNRLQNLLDTPIQNNQISAGHFNILQGNVGEVLARPLLDQTLEEVRREAADAQLYLGVRARILRSDGTASDPVLFSDGLIAAIRPGGLQIFRVAEIKSGGEGGVQGQEQIHRWIEGHSTTEVEILIPGVARGFRISDTVREVVGLARAPRVIIAPRGSSFPTERSGHGVAAPTQRLELPQSAEEIRYLAQLVAQQIIQRQQAQQLLNQVQANQLVPASLTRIDELQSPAVVRRLLSQNAGTALIQGQLYRVAIEGTSIRVRVLPAGPIAVPRLAALPGQSATTPGVPLQPLAQGNVGTGVGTGGPTPAQALTASPLLIPFTPPSGGLVPPNVINFTGNDIVVGGRVVGPTPSGGQLRVGELIVVGFSNYWVVGDIRNRQPIAGVFEGGQWYQVTVGGRVLPIDANGRIRTEVEPIPFEHLPSVARTRSAGVQGGPTGSGYGGGTRAVAGGLGIIMIANEILGPIGQVLQVQRRNIQMGIAEINFWIRFNANPSFGVWSQSDRVPLPVDSSPETSVFGSPSYPYVADIDVEAFKAALPLSIGSYRDYLLFLDLAKTLGTIIEEPQMPQFPSPEERREPRRYYAFVNKDDREGRRRYDITDAMLALRDRLVEDLDTEMRGRLRGLPAGERSNILRLRSGSATPVFRSARGGQPILSDQQLFGDDPWVRPVGRTAGGGVWNWFRHGPYDDRILVEPANADARRGSVVAVYAVKRPIEEVLDEVREGGRPIEDRQPAEGRLESFVAGPEPGNSRFGETRYYRHPGMPHRQTAAIGELRQFWVNADDVAPAGVPDVNAYGDQAPAPRP